MFHFQRLHTLDVSFCIGVTRQIIGPLNDAMARTHGKATPGKCPEDQLNMFRLSACRSGIQGNVFKQQCSPWIKLVDTDYALIIPPEQEAVLAAAELVFFQHEKLLKFLAKKDILVLTYIRRRAGQSQWVFELKIHKKETKRANFYISLFDLQKQKSKFSD